MSRIKNEVLTIRTTAAVKDLLRLAAGREHRSVASMVETLIYAYAEEHGLKSAEKSPPSAKKRG